MAIGVSQTVWLFLDWAEGGSHQLEIHHVTSMGLKNRQSFLFKNRFRHGCPQEEAGKLVQRQRKGGRKRAGWCRKRSLQAVSVHARGFLRQGREKGGVWRNLCHAVQLHQVSLLLRGWQRWLGFPEQFLDHCVEASLFICLLIDIASLSCIYVQFCLHIYPLVTFRQKGEEGPGGRNVTHQRCAHPAQCRRRGI